MLVIGRAIQGAFGALLAPAALSTLAVTFSDPAERGKAFRGLRRDRRRRRLRVGLLLGGVLTEYLSWRWCLYVNVVLALLAVTGAVRLLANQPRDTKVYLDPAGTILVVAGLVGVVYGLGGGRDQGVGARRQPSLCWEAGVVLLAAFVLVERRVPHPLLPLRIVLTASGGGSYLAIGLSAVGLFGGLPVPHLLPAADPALLAGRDGPGVPADDRGADRDLDDGQRGAAAAIRAPDPDTRRDAGGGGRAGHTRGATGREHQLSQHDPARSGGDRARAWPGVRLRDQHGNLRAAREDAGVASAMVNINQQVGGSIGIALLNTIAASAFSSYLLTHGQSLAAQAGAAVHSYIVAFWISAGIFAGAAVVCGLVLPPGLLASAAPEVAPATA